MPSSNTHDTNDSEVTLQITGVAGSLRAASLNKKLLSAASNLAPENMFIHEQDISSIPLYNADLEFNGAPEPVVEFKKAILESDGLLIVTPEYNFGLPAVTKNLIDWASLKSHPGNVLYRKPIAIMGIGGGTRGNTSLARMEVRQTVVFPGALPMPNADVGISGGASNFDSSGTLIDEDAIQRVTEYLVSFKHWIEFIKGR